MILCVICQGLSNETKIVEIYTKRRQLISTATNLKHALKNSKIGLFAEQLKFFLKHYANFFRILTVKSEFFLQNETIN